jgi:nucleoside-diphosphate-sugar epimerase
MFTLVAGTGYTGLRVLKQLPADDSVGVNSASMNLDNAEPLPVDVPASYAVLYTVPPAGRSDARLRHFLTELRPAPERFVYVSTTGVYGDCRGATVTEESPANATNDMSRPRLDAETLLAEWTSREGCELVILRVPGIYGPGRLPLQRIREGGAFLEDADTSPGNRIHVDDLTRCCLAALNDATPSGVYNVGDGDHRSATWFAQEVARQAGLPAPRLISRDQAEEEFSPVRLAFMSSSRIVDTTKMREVLRVELKYPNPADGIAASLPSDPCLLRL